jgi:dsRNA-specific ribonuclease
MHTYIDTVWCACLMMVAVGVRQGHKAARAFLGTHILSRNVDVLATLPMDRPKALLAALLTRQGRAPPETRCVCAYMFLSVCARD